MLLNRTQLAQDKGVVRRTDRPNMTIAVDLDVKHQTKQINIEQRNNLSGPLVKDQI